MAGVGSLAAQGLKRGKPRDPRPQELVGAGRWLTDGGGLARNAASANAPVLKRPKLAWRQPIEGTLVGEPRVWDDYIALGVHVNDKRRRVEVRRLSDGELIGKREINSTAVPSVAIWGSEVIWRSAPGTFELLRFDPYKVQFLKRMRKAGRVSPPLRIGRNLLAIVDGKVLCMRTADFRERWSGASSCVGTLSVLGDRVYALQKSGEGYQVVAHELATGKLVGRSANVQLRRAPGEDLRMQLAGRTLIARFGSGNLLAQYRAPGSELNAMQFALPLRPGATPQPMALKPLHALDPNLHFCPTQQAKGLQLALYPTDSLSGIRLDSCDLHRTLGQVPATMVRGVVYFGACAIETNEFRMLWRMQKAGDGPLPRSRVIPAGRMLLMFDETQLVALRDDVPDDAIATELNQSLRVAERDLVEPLVLAAIKARDWPHATELLARARELQVDEKWATKCERNIERGKRSRSAKVRANPAKQVREAVARVDGAALVKVQDAVASWANERDAIDYRKALRFLLRRDPNNASAVAQVRKMVPKGMQPTEPFQALDWLDYVGATSRTKVNLLEASLDDFSGETKLDPIDAQNKQQLLEWRGRWRKDLQALQSKRVLMFSSVESPGSMAKAVATGELVCDLLESMFGHMPKVRNDPRPMLVFIYSDRLDYLRESMKIGAKIAEQAAGYYSWQEKPAKSRLYVPSDDAGFQAVLPTLAHELTHHWLMDQCPAFQPDAAAALMGPKAFWIVEGFASLIEQFEFDFERRQFRLGDGGSQDRADLVVSLKTSQRLHWNWLVGATRMQFSKFWQDKQSVDVASRTRLGRGYQVRRVNLFYAQSAMLARYLYEAEDGRYRQKLLDFVVNYYTGKLDELEFEKAFGISGKEIGPKVVAFAKKLVE